MFRVTCAVTNNVRQLSKSELRRFLASAATVEPKAKDETIEKKKEPTSTNLSFMKNIFRGELQPAEVFPYPDILSSDQKEFTVSLTDPFEKFFIDINNSSRNDENAQIDENTLNALWELGAFGLQVSPDLGGLGLNNTQYGRMCEIVGGHDLGLGITIGAHQSIGFKGILLFGNEEQKQKYLPKVAAGKTYAAFALTEPSAGSDAASIKCKAVKSPDGSHYILNGSKIWISNGGIADVMTVFAQLETVDEKTGEKRNKMTAFIVERGFGGVSNGAPEKKMGIRCSNTAEVYFEDCKVPAANVLGGEGNGFKVAMNILNNGRFGMGATMSGTMKFCIKKATEHANQRTQFGKKIKDYGAIQEKLGRMAMHQYATQSMAYTISQNMDSGRQDFLLEAAISKVFASESAWYVCDEAIQIMGGMGFMKSAELERVMRDLRIFRIFEGTNDILRLFVALTGIQYAGAHLKELQSAFKNPAANLGLLIKESSRRAKLSMGLSGTDLTPFVHQDLQASAKKTGQCIDAFGKTVESLLLKHKKNIINQQFQLNRLADAAIDIYAMVVTLSRATRAAKLNYPTTAHELILTKAWCNEASERAQRNLKKATSGEFNEHAIKVSDIAKTVTENDGVFTTHPIEN